MALEDLKIKILLQLLNDYGFTSPAYPKEFAKIWNKISSLKINWLKKNNLYLTQINGDSWFLHQNLKTDQPRYTLLIKQKVILSFNQLPQTGHYFFNKLTYPKLLL